MDCYEYFLSVPLIKLWRSNAMSCYNFVQFLTEKLALPLKEGLVHLTEAFTCMKLTTDFSNVVKKEIKPVTPKGNQSWIFIGRTDAKAKAPMLQPPDAKDWLTEKDPDAGKDWKWEEKGQQRIRCLDAITYMPNTDMSLSKVQELVIDREDCMPQSMGSQRVGHTWVTELKWI